jgi:hypothetical protein
MKDESTAVLAERFNQCRHIFILPPSAFILAFNEVNEKLYAGLPEMWSHVSGR